MSDRIEQHSAAEREKAKAAHKDRIKNQTEIIASCEGLMVARGDRDIETAKEDFPVIRVKTMAEIAKEAEACIWNDRIFGDKLRLISGAKSKNVFLQTGLPQNIIVRLWNLCDMKQ